MPKLTPQREHIPLFFFLIDLLVPSTIEVLIFHLSYVFHIKHARWINFGFTPYYVVIFMFILVFLLLSS